MGRGFIKLAHFLSILGALGPKVGFEKYWEHALFDIK